MALSADGKWALALVPTSPQSMFAYPLGAGDPLRLERANLDFYSQALFFRDGARVLVNAAEPGKGLRYYVQDLKGSAPRAVTPEGTRFGLLSADEKSILACGPSGEFSVYPLEGGEPRPVKGLSATDLLLQWSADGSSALVSRQGPVPGRVERVDLESGTHEQVLTLAPPDLAGVVGIFPTCVTEDLKSYVYSCTRRTATLFLSEVRR